MKMKGIFAKYIFISQENICCKTAEIEKMVKDAWI